MNHHSTFVSAIERSRARRRQAEHQLRSLRGTPLQSPYAELDSLIVHELRLEDRLASVLARGESAVPPGRGPDRAAHE